ncbi:hypothetical protein N7468_001565 [Penicillium chermesinum]|uniref:Uncharacterized protein n=1 Tax=Penicillium chermesinum TaxID=63820 RepID=A0A9W9PJT5_9EURO|nr:uncharacterized protein N7468_001565 [Penicillium chermesinum]KAJ5246582.1 hypothetical protein N7468_001565 [Penicillium chermesinum]KAJ6144852.1 hypothetical protein N7470_008747 [Penicillium chermesinum]
MPPKKTVCLDSKEKFWGLTDAEVRYVLMAVATSDTPIQVRLTNIKGCSKFDGDALSNALGLKERSAITMVRKAMKKLRTAASKKAKDSEAQDASKSQESSTPTGKKSKKTPEIHGDSPTGGFEIEISIPSRRNDDDHAGSSGNASPGAATFA